MCKCRKFNMSAMCKCDNFNMSVAILTYVSHVQLTQISHVQFGQFYHASVMCKCGNFNITAMCYVTIITGQPCANVAILIYVSHLQM